MLIPEVPIFSDFKYEINGKTCKIFETNKTRRPFEYLFIEVETGITFKKRISKPLLEKTIIYSGLTVSHQGTDKTIVNKTLYGFEVNDGTFEKKLNPKEIKEYQRCSPVKGNETQETTKHKSIPFNLKKVNILTQTD